MKLNANGGEPEIVSKPAPAYTMLAPAFFAVIGIYLLVVAQSPVYWVGLVLLIYVIWLVYYSRRFALTIYADRIVINYLFSKNPNTIFLTDIRSCTEVHGGRGGYAILLSTDREKFVFYAGMFSNYIEIKNKLVPSQPISPAPTGWKFQLKRIIAYIFLVLFVLLMIYARRHGK